MTLLALLDRAAAVAAAEGLHADLGAMLTRLFPFDPFADRVWELRYTMTSHDAWHVAVAEALHLPLATLGCSTRSSRAALLLQFQLR